MYEILKTNSEIQNLQNLLIDKFKLNPKIEVEKHTVWGKKNKTIYYHPEYNIWFYEEKNDDNKDKLKFLNGFGIGKPTTQTAIIDCQINFPVNSEENNLSGKLANNDRGELMILHTGNFSKMKNDFFRENYRGKYVESKDGKSYVFVGEMNSNKLIEQITDFVKEVIRIKKLNKGISS